MTLIQNEARDVRVPEDGEQLREGIHEEAWNLSQVLLVLERAVAESPPPRHEYGVALVLQIDAREEPPPGGRHSESGGGQGGRREH